MSGMNSMRRKKAHQDQAVTRNAAAASVAMGFRCPYSSHLNSTEEADQYLTEWRNTALAGQSEYATAGFDKAYAQTDVFSRTRRDAIGFLGVIVSIDSERQLSFARRLQRQADMRAVLHRNVGPM